MRTTSETPSSVNTRYLGDVSKIDFDLLSQILPHCTVDQLMNVEKCTRGRDLSPITDKLWRKFYEDEFGAASAKLIAERMKKAELKHKWLRLYEAKKKQVDEAKIDKAVNQMVRRYKEAEALKRSRQVQLWTKVAPDSSRKRGFLGGSGPGNNVLNVKKNIMKKARTEFLKSYEVRNLAFMKGKAVKTSLQRAAPLLKSGAVPGKIAASTSKF